MMLLWTDLVQQLTMQCLGTSEEMVRIVLFMVSDGSFFMTGNTLTVDGGYTAQ